MKIACAVLFAAALPCAWPAENTVRPELSFSKTFGGSASNTGVAVATDPLGNIYYAGTTMSADFPIVNGFQKGLGGTPVRATTDGGKTWTKPPIFLAFYAVAGAPKQPAVIYAGTSAALFKSTDSGKTWTYLTSAGTALFNALWVDPETPSVVHAATDGGMLRSTDGGATWNASPSGKGNFLAMAASLSRPATLFAASTRGVYRSVDSGASWTPLPNAPSGPIALTCDPAKAGVVYLVRSTAGFAQGGTTAVYKSTDSGDTWRVVSDASIVISTWTIAATADVVYLATSGGLLRSADGGASWQATPITASADAIGIDPTQPKNVYVSTERGIFASVDSDATWTSILPVRQLVEALAVAPTTPPTLFVGADSGRNVFVSKWTPDGARLLYSTCLGGSYYDYVTGLAVDRQGNAYVTGYASSTDFPVTAKAAQSKHGGSYDAFLAKIGPNGDSLLYSTYLGGASADVSFAVALDASSNAYVTGYTASSAFPVTPGAYQTRLREYTDCLYVGIWATPPVRPVLAANAFVAKVDTVSGAMRYSTLLGGGCEDEGVGIAVDSAGAAYIAGVSFSPDFPVSAGVLQGTAKGRNGVGFLAKLSPQGDGLTYATYLGGNFGAGAFGVAVDAKGAAYVTGTSAGFDSSPYVPPGLILTPVGVAGYPPVGFSAYRGGAAFAAKVDPAARSLEYLRYLGRIWGVGTGIALDGSGNAWIAGSTAPTLSLADPFPTLHPFQAKTGGGFLARLAPDGAVTFGSLANDARQVALDPAGNAFVSGTSGNLALLLRVDAAVPSAMTIEEPRNLAPGRILVLSGSGLGPAQPVTAQPDAAGRFPTILAGTTVTFGNLAAPLLSVAADQILCAVPFGVTPASTLPVQARNGGNASNAITLPVAASAIELLALVNADGTPNSREHPAAPGSIVVVYGTGFGQTEPSGRDGTINSASPAKFTAGVVAVAVEDQPAEVLYAGPAPGQVAGAVQVNFRIPALSAGAHTAVVGWSAVGGLVGQDAPIWIGQP